MSKKNKRKTDPVWDYRQIRKFSWDTVFHKGWRAWLALVAVCFLFSFIGASSPMQTEILDYVDPYFGYNKDAGYEQNVEYLKEYVLSRKAVSGLSDDAKATIGSTIESISTSNSWVIRALASNAAYFERNPGEVIVNLVLIALLPECREYRHVQIRYGKQTAGTCPVPKASCAVPSKIHSPCGVGDAPVLRSVDPLVYAVSDPRHL